MKIKALADAAKVTRQAWLLDKYDGAEKVARQYVAIGGGIYPLDGLREIDENTLLTIFDVPRDDRETWTVRRDRISDFQLELTEDSRPSDREASFGRITLQYNGVEYRTLYTVDHGMLFLTKSQLKPLSDMKNLTFWTREHGEGVVVAAMNGLFNVAALQPVEMWVDEETAQEICHAANAARAIANRNMERQMGR